MTSGTGGIRLVLEERWRIPADTSNGRRAAMRVSLFLLHGLELDQRGGWTSVSLNSKGRFKGRKQKKFNLETWSSGFIPTSRY
jgi:hypothetical protein